MPQYKYVAANDQGKLEKGNLEAENAAELFRALTDKKLHCIRYENSEENAAQTTTYRMKTREVVVFCRQIETMVAAGLLIPRAFELLESKTERKKLKQLYANVYESLQTGSSLSMAMKKEGKSFPPFLIHMIASGEDSGTLDQVMHRMSIHFTNEMKIAGKLKTAMIYPALLTTVSVGVVILLFTFVLPRLFSLFEGADLPMSTRFLMWLSETMINHWMIILVMIGVIVAGFYSLAQTEQGRLFLDRQKVRWPVFGKLMKTVYTARFSNAMATLYSSGISIIRALEISCEILLNTHYTREFTSIIANVGSGQSLASAMEGSTLFDPMFISLIFIGEESGNLEDVLNQASDYYDSEAQSAMEKMVALFEPIMILALAFVVGFIVISVIMPIYSMYSMVG